MVPELAAILLLAVGPEMRPSILNEPHGASLPLTCNQGDTYILTSATTGRQQYTCESANTWVLQGDALGAADPGSNGLMARTALNATAARTLTFGLGLTGTNLSGASANPNITFDYTGTLAGNLALSAGQCVFDSGDGSSFGGLLCELSAANNGEFFLQMGNAASITDRTTIVPDGPSTTAITLSSVDLNETFTGVKTAKTINGEQHSFSYADIATARAALSTGTASTSTAVVVVDPNEDDTAVFKDINPAGKNAAGTTTGVSDAMVKDTRNGTLKFMSSAPQYPIYAGGDSLSDKGASKVPYSFWVRRDDASQPFTDINADFTDNDASINEWNCMQNAGHCTTTTTTTASGTSTTTVLVASSTKFANGEAIKIGSNGIVTIVSGGGTTTWTISSAQTFSNGATVVKPCVTDATCTSEACTAYSSETTEYYNCPNLMDATNTRNPWGRTGASTWWMYAGVCPQDTASPGAGRMSTGGACGGPGILDVGLVDEQGGGRPLFHIGTAGVNLYEPYRHSDLWDGWMTFFRGEEPDFWNSAVFNTPMFHFSKYGFYGDGGQFNGGVTHWPRFTNETYPTYWGLWTQADGDGTKPQMIVEGSSSSGADFRKSPLMRIINRYGFTGQSHDYNEGTNQEYAFDFYSNSVMKMRSKDLGGSSLTTDQRIEWEGTTIDANHVTLGILTDPTSVVSTNIPDKSGTLVISALSSTSGPAAWAANGVTCATACTNIGQANCADSIPLDGTNTPLGNCTGTTGPRLCECY